MRINSKLNLVVEVETSEGTIFVHSMPLSREVFERYFIVIGKTFSSVMSSGLSVISGPRVAAMMLKKIATEEGVWDGRDGVENGLFAEIRRLSNVIYPTTAGWQSLPLQAAVDREVIDADDLSEVENLITFFICVSAMVRKGEIQGILEKMLLWGARTSSLNSTEYQASLQTLIATETTSPKEKTSSVPH